MSAPDYDELYRDSSPPWEIGGLQPAIAAVLGEAKGPHALDLGCGTGELAIALARRGFRVTGVDVSRVAIETAKAKAAGLNIDFRVQDATRLALPPGRFDSIFDCGLLHNLHRHGGAGEYVAQLPGLAAPGATLFLLAVSAAAGQDWSITEDYLRATFAEPLWTRTRIEKTEVVARVGDEELRLPGFLVRAAAPPRPASP